MRVSVLETETKSLGSQYQLSRLRLWEVSLSFETEKLLMVETKTETETRILTIFEKETARDRPLDVETEVETKISGWYASVTYNKHGYAISSRYSCKYTVCKLSSSSHLPIPLLILHQSLYFVLRLGYILLLPSQPPPPPPHLSNKSYKNGICKDYPS